MEEYLERDKRIVGHKEKNYTVTTATICTAGRIFKV
jgi:hypothetical protein